MKVDPVLLGVLINAFTSLTDEMGFALIRSAYSNNIKIRRDCSCAIYEARGEMVAQGHFIPVHLGILPNAIKEVLKEFPIEELNPGDVIITNDPYRMGSHLWDVMLFSPLYCDEEPIAIAGNLAHHIDIGGKDFLREEKAEIFDEGLRIEPMKLVEKGKLKEDLLRLITAQLRCYREVRGDLMAQIAAINRADRALRELVRRYGKETILQYMKAILEHSETMMADALMEIEDGEGEAEDYVELREELLPIRVKVKKAGGDVYVDFSGSAGPTETSINAPWSLTLSATYFAIKSIVAPNIPTNSGTYRRIHVERPQEPSILDAKWPRAVGACTSCPTNRVVDVIFKAFFEIAPERVTACTEDWPAGGVVGWNPKKKAFFSFVETYAGGHGAKHNQDGMDAAHATMTNTLNAPVESIELEFPLLVNKYAILPDTGGAGKYRGGVGITRVITLLVPCTGGFSVQRYRVPPWGLCGGLPGSRAVTGYITPDGKKFIGSTSYKPHPAGTQIFVETSGGGGWGNPLERDPEKVRWDVLNEFVTIESARKIYGVVIDKNTYRVDYEKTRLLREELKKRRKNLGEKNF